MPLDGARTDEQLRADLCVRATVGSKARDECLLRRQLVERIGSSFADGLTRREQLVARPFGKRTHPHRREHLVRSAEVFAHVDASVLTPEPLPVQQVSTREIGANRCSCQPIDRLSIEVLGQRTIGEERFAPAFDAQCPVGTTGFGGLRELPARRGGSLGSATARCSFDELGKVDVLPLRPGVLQGLGGGGQRLFVLPASVVERRTRPESARQRAVEAQGACACDLVVDQQGGAIVSPEGGQVRHIRREDGERAPRRRQDLLRLGERRFGPVEVAFVDEQVRKGVERHWEHGQCAELTCGRDVCERELAKIHMVPQEVRRGGLEPREVKLLGFERVAPTGRQRLSQCRHGRRVPVDLEFTRARRRANRLPRARVASDTRAPRARCRGCRRPCRSLPPMPPR